MCYQLTGQMVRYVGTFGLSILLSAVIGYVLTLLGSSVTQAGTILVPFYWTLKFFLYKYWVFGDAKPRWLQQPGLYVVFCLVSGAILVLLQNQLQSVLKVPDLLALSTSFLFVGTMRFVLFRYLFRQPPATH